MALPIEKMAGWFAHLLRKHYQWIINDVFAENRGQIFKIDINFYQKLFFQNNRSDPFFFESVGRLSTDQPGYLKTLECT